MDWELITEYLDKMVILMKDAKNAVDDADESSIRDITKELYENIVGIEEVTDAAVFG